MAAGDTRMKQVAWMVHQACNHMGWVRRFQLGKLTPEEKEHNRVIGKIRQMRIQMQMQIQEANKANNG